MRQFVAPRGGGGCHNRIAYIQPPGNAENFQDTERVLRLNRQSRPHNQRL